jgi:hypothetical protein
MMYECRRSSVCYTSTLVLCFWTHLLGPFSYRHFIDRSKTAVKPIILVLDNQRRPKLHISSPPYTVCVVLIINHLLLYLYLVVVFGEGNGEFCIGGHIIYIVRDDAFQKWAVLQAGKDSILCQILVTATYALAQNQYSKLRESVKTFQAL